MVKLSRDPTDPAKPWRGTTAADTVSTPVTAVFVGFRKADVDGGLIRRGDQKVLVKAAGLPDITGYDEVVDSEGIKWRIVNVEAVRPGAVTLLYKLQVRS